jgi:hypothetical protein
MLDRSTATGMTRNAFGGLSAEKFNSGTQVERAERAIPGAGRDGKLFEEDSSTAADALQIEELR